MQLKMLKNEHCLPTSTTGEWLKANQPISQPVSRTLDFNENDSRPMDFREMIAREREMRVECQLVRVELAMLLVVVLFRQLCILDLHTYLATAEQHIQSRTLLLETLQLGNMPALEVKMLS